MSKFTGLIIMDGFGIDKDSSRNAITIAGVPYIKSLIEKYPTTQIGASGLDVGLPDGQMGNSEVGHLNMGAGRIVYQELTRITKAITDGDFFTNEVFLSSIRNAKANGKKVHLMGLLSDGHGPARCSDPGLLRHSRRSSAGQPCFRQVFPGEVPRGYLQPRRFRRCFPRCRCCGPYPHLRCQAAHESRYC